ncbi:MAG: response regulator transcription factor [Burkholderiales bacterium]|nr:response regulator transcription factor [Burkholderiales bacterium]
MAPLSVLIVDSHDIARFALETMILGAPGLRLLGSAGTLAAGLMLIRQRRPDLVLLELALPDSRGLDTVRSVVAAQRPRHTLVVSMMDESLYGEQALAAGAEGYVHKDRAQADLLPAVQAVASGQRWISPALNSRMLDRLLRRGRAPDSSHPSFTARELDVLEQLKTGKSSKQIAQYLGISTRTVDLHRAHMKKKLGLRSGAELVAFASHHF